MNSLLEFTSSGIYCPVADLYIDPWKPVDKAIITHAHADHARIGMRKYLAHKDTVPILRHMLGMYIDAREVDYGETITINGVKISLHPAGHIVGSSQVRLEYKGQIWVVSGDYKLTDDRICKPYEPVKCDVLVSDSTFGLPIFKWKDQDEVFDEINNWWVENSKNKVCSVLVGYSLGKAQRILHHLNDNIGAIYAHHSIENVNKVLARQGMRLPEIHRLTSGIDPKELRNALVLAPPSTINTPWIENFEPCSVAVASGWMSLRKARRKGRIDKGFILSDHADWGQLQEAVKLSGAKEIYLTHNHFSSSFYRWLIDSGYQAREVFTKFRGEIEEVEETIDHDE